MKIRVEGELLKINYRPFNSGGKGGQHGNRSLNAMECTVKLPDGRIIKAVSTTSKCQHTNRKRAQKVLAARVISALQRVRERGFAAIERVRTYHAVDNRVTDHASGLKRSYRDVMDGDGFGELVKARREALILKAACE